MLGSRLKTARMASGLSLQELSERLMELGYNITKATLSNYENGKYIPNNELLNIICQELNTSLEDLSSDSPEVPFDIRFFNLPEMIERKRQNLEAFIIKELTRFHYIDSLLGLDIAWKLPKKKNYSLSAPHEIEKLAMEIREEYHMGDYAVASVCGSLEKKGWHIFSLPYFCDASIMIAGYDAISGTPFILYKPDGFQDELRLSLLKALGYSLIEGNSSKETQKLVSRFARSVLLTEDLLKYTFGEKRSVITEHELTTGKRMYGIGKKYIMQRMSELNIISPELYKEYVLYIAQRHDLVRSSGLLDDSNFFDVPTTYEMRVARANAEGLSTIQGQKNIYTGKLH